VVGGVGGSTAGTGSSPGPVVRGSPAGGAAGSRTVNVVPCPAALAAVTVPPWAATMAETIDSPRPAPPWRRDRLGSDR
jgi:hypothetical protein